MDGQRMKNVYNIGRKSAEAFIPKLKSAGDKVAVKRRRHSSTKWALSREWGLYFCYEQNKNRREPKYDIFSKIRVGVYVVLVLVQVQVQLKLFGRTAFIVLTVVHLPITRHTIFARHVEYRKTLAATLLLDDLPRRKLDIHHPPSFLK